MNLKRVLSRTKGMSSVELLLSILLIGSLVLIVTILIDRGYGIKQARDITRFNHVQLILGSVLLYEVDSEGNVPPEIDDDEQTWQMIGRLGEVCTTVCPNRKVEKECIYLEELVPKYLESIPQDAFFTELGPTGYYINKKRNENIVTVGACKTEIADFIEIQQ